MKCSCFSLWILTLDTSLSSVAELFWKLAHWQVSDSLLCFLAELCCSSLTVYWKRAVLSAEQKLFPLPASLPSSPWISLIMRTGFFNLLDFPGAHFWESSKWLESTARRKPEGWGDEIINRPVATLAQKVFSVINSSDKLSPSVSVQGDQQLWSLPSPTLKVAGAARGATRIGPSPGPSAPVPPGPWEALLCSPAPGLLACFLRAQCKTKQKVMHYLQDFPFNTFTLLTALRMLFVGFVLPL